jgi:hypothetical protein
MKFHIKLAYFTKAHQLSRKQNLLNPNDNLRGFRLPVKFFFLIFDLIKGIAKRKLSSQKAKNQSL